MKAKNVIEVTDFVQDEWEELVQRTVAFKHNKHVLPSALKNKSVGLLFSGNSLRTRISFELATHLLGGSSYFLEIRNLTNEKDGVGREALADIVSTLDRMVDCYIVRDYSRKILDVLQQRTGPPVINGFCSVGHPSQALADVSAIRWKRGTNRNLAYATVCPGEGSGVIESFIYAVLLLGESVTIITPTGEFKGKNKDFHTQAEKLSKEYGGRLQVTKNIQNTVKHADVLYVDEWWENTKYFLHKQPREYRVDDEFLAGHKEDLMILHCLPAHWGREITAEVMRGTNSIIFDEAEFRIYSAMSLLCHLHMVGRNCGIAVS
jgi:ornithine carbamoyltransferase